MVEIEKKNDKKCKTCDMLRKKNDELNLKISQLKSDGKKVHTEKEKELLEKRKLRNSERRKEFELEQKQKEEKYEKIQQLNIDLQEKLLNNTPAR